MIISKIEYNWDPERGASRYTVGKGCKGIYEIIDQPGVYEVLLKDKRIRIFNPSVVTYVSELAIPIENA